MTEKQSLRERQKQETRRQIQQAARKLITEGGYKKTTMRGLAELAGVGVGTISLHFKDKKSLLLSTFYDEIQELSDMAVESARDDAPLRDQLLSMLKVMYDYYGSNTIFMRTVVKEALFASGDWRKRFDAQLGGVLNKVAERVEKAKATGEVRPDTESMKVAVIIWSVYLNGLIEGVNAERFEPEMRLNMVAELMDVILSGIMEVKHA